MLNARCVSPPWRKTAVSSRYHSPEAIFTPMAEKRRVKVSTPGDASDPRPPPKALLPDDCST